MLCPESLLADLDAQAVALAARTLVTDTRLGALWRRPKLLRPPRLSHIKSSHSGAVSVAESVWIRKYSLFSKSPTHRVCLFVIESPSDRVRRLLSARTAKSLV